MINLQNKLGITYAILDEATIIFRVKDAHAKRKHCKQMAEELSVEYRLQLAKAKEAAGEMSIAAVIKNMNKIEGQRHLFGYIWHMEGKVRGGSASQVTVTTEGVAREYMDRKDVEEMTAHNNK